MGGVELFADFYVAFFMEKENGDYHKPIAYPVHPALKQVAAEYGT